jgi:hypothetical protein
VEKNENEKRKTLKNFNRFIIYEHFYLLFANEHEHSHIFLETIFFVKNEVMVAFWVRRVYEEDQWSFLGLILTEI